MKSRSESEDTGPSLRDKIIGLGNRSIRKSYYLQLRKQLEETEKSRSHLEEKSAALQNMLEDLEKARSSLADSQARYRSLVENISDVIFSLDGMGNVTYISPVIQNLSGLMPEQIIGRPFQDFVRTDDQPALAAGFERVLAGQPEPFEFQLMGTEGFFRYVRASVRPLVEEGRVVGLTGVMSDITDRKQAEATIRALNETLESRLLAFTQPVGDVSNIHLSDLFNIDELQKIQDSFALATGVASIITDTQGRPITKPSNFCRLCEHLIRKTDKGLLNCYRSDASLGRMYPKGPILQRCLSGGLWDAGTSICVGDQHIANWLIGQVLEEPVNEEAMMAYAREIGADEEEFRNALAQVTRMPIKQFEKVADALYLIANQLSKLAIQNVQQARFITERKRAEEKNLQLAAIVESSGDAIIGKTPEGFVTSWNKGAETIYGYSESEMIGKPISLLVPPEREEEIPRLLDMVCRGEHVEHFETVRRRKDGQCIHMSLTLSPIRDGNGRVIGVSTIGRDITEHKRAEEEIRRWNAELEQRVAERTGQLEIANKELEAFSYSVSHDLRTPLRSADGFSQILMEDYADRLDPQAKDYLRRIQNATRRMSQLIEDLLKLSRITRSEISRKDVDLTALSLAVADELRKTEPDRRVEFVITPDLRIHADENLMRIVMENLLGNAWKFTRKVPNAQIEVGLTRQEGKTVYFVRDNGAGFDEAYAGKLFVPFQRLHAATEFEGTGIGLSIVQRIIRRHNGRIWAQGTVGKGATFFFTTAPAP